MYFARYEYLLVYQQYCTKLVDHRSLRDKRKQTVARALIEIFTTLIAPRLFHTDNGTEFSGIALDVPLSAFDPPEIIEELALPWLSCRIVNGASRHSPSQGKFE